MNRLSILVIILISGAKYIECQGQTCNTSRNESGQCGSILKCQPFIDLLQDNDKTQTDIEYIRLSTCEGTDGKYPLACCPTVTEASNDTLNQSGTQRIVLPECGVANVISSQRVVGGVPAKLGEFPWVVALGYKNKKNENLPNWHCAGAIITNKHILTAAHCISPDLYVVRLGDLDLYSNEDGATPLNVLISSQRRHENFNSEIRANDIAILTLREEIKFGPLIRPICLPTAESIQKDYTNEPTYVAGWGSTYFNGPMSPGLRVVLLPILRLDRCLRTYGSRFTIDQNTLCAGQLSGGRDACSGDSGGPLMYETSDQVTQLLGVVSYGSGCAQAGMAGVYTRTDKYLQWINDNIK
ncbi:uncharacterized protein CBL_01806 [Carabus blaptoides fortunei]